jgi:LAO/AO transport system kinase
MSGYVASTALLEGVAAGDPRAIARLISRAEAGAAEARAALAAIYHRAGAAHVIGITGVPGSGKSTLVARLAQRLRERGERVGIVAIDPSSPYSGGAILGDRIRMSEVAADPGIYIRSMATRGATGGLARAALDACDILDVAGYRTILIETVGVGQDEVEIARASDTTIVVSAPGLGDEVQAIKAGVLEIADIHVVSKCDRSDAQRTLMDLKNMLALGMTTTGPADWRAPVVGTSSVSGEGFDDLLAAIDAHRAASRDSALGRARRQKIAAFRLHKTAQTLLLEAFERSAGALQAAFAQRLAQRDGDPYTLARELVAASLRKEYPNESA